MQRLRNVVTICILVGIAASIVGCAAAQEARQSVGEALVDATLTPVPFKTTALKVAAGTSRSVNFDLPAGATIEYSFNSELDIDFRVLDPQGDRLSVADRVLAHQGKVVAGALGRYVLVFDNEFSLFASKTVNLRYRTVPPGGR